MVPGDLHPVDAVERVQAFDDDTVIPHDTGAKVTCPHMFEVIERLRLAKSALFHSRIEHLLHLRVRANLERKVTTRVPHLMLLICNKTSFQALPTNRTYLRVLPNETCVFTKDT